MNIIIVENFINQINSFDNELQLILRNIQDSSEEDLFRLISFFKNIKLDLSELQENINHVDSEIYKKAQGYFIKG